MAARDVYGFQLVPLTEAECASRTAASTALLKQANYWNAVLPLKNGTIPIRTQQQSYKSLTRRGIPVELRPKLWFWLSGAQGKMHHADEGYYRRFSVARTLNKEVLFSIERDVQNTFRQHPTFQSREGVAALRRLLVAVAQHSPAAGYVCGLNYVASFLLIVLGLDKEEEAFWTLAALFEERLFCYCQGQAGIGAKVEQKILDALVQKKLPKVYEHVTHTLGTNLSSLTCGWFGCLFTTVLPAETTARIWDALIVEGPKVLLRVGLTLLKKYESTILSCTDLTRTRKVLEARTCRAFDADSLMNHAFKGVGSMSNSGIVQLRVAAQQEVEEHLLDYQKRLNFIICRTH